MLIKKLYKRTQTGAVQEWEIYVEGNTYFTIHGQQAGKKITSIPTTCEAKNLSRANGTTAEEQAMLEAESKVRSQITKHHYKENIEDIDNIDFIKVQLATTYDKVKDKMTFKGAFIQPKLDGIRYVCDSQKSYSRSGKPLLGAQFIYDKMSALFEKYPDLVTDGELYNHDFHEKFSELVSMIKKDPSKLSNSKLNELHEYLQYHVYDIISVDGLTAGDKYTKRIDRFWNIINDEFPELDKYIKFVPYVPCNNHEDVDHWQSFYMENGYEGAIVRYNRGYEQKRSKWLIKVKEFSDKEFEIIDILEGKGNRSGMAGTIVCKLDDPVEGKDDYFGAGIKGGVEFYNYIWGQKEDLIGKSATVRFFGRNPDTNVPRFPVCVMVNRESFE